MSACRHKTVCSLAHRRIDALEDLRCFSVHDFFDRLPDCLIGSRSKDRIYLRDLINDLLLVALCETSGYDQRL